MSQLKTYKAKRHFRKTPEPKGVVKKDVSQQLIFTIQKHAATRLHYDFRLECDGVLKSWAIPKGPSLNPKDKRLAIMVEDHPYDYHDFEGIIPKGNYGAGTVMLWDEGTYLPYPPADSKKENEKKIRDGIIKGRLEFTLCGHKLQGIFVLIKIKSEEENQWLFFKKADEFSSDKVDILAKDHSVGTERSMQEIAGNVDKASGGNLEKLLKNAPKAKMPDDIQPMLAVLAPKPFDKKGWIFELKWDGYRALAYIKKKGKVNLLSRNQKSFNQLFSIIAEELSSFTHEAILDGEIVILDDNGIPQFQLIQNYQRNKSGNLFYYVFDVLYLDGKDLRSLPLLQRKEILKNIIPATPDSRIRISEFIETNGAALFKEAAKNNIEGIIGKDNKSPYIMGRSHSWEKIKAHQSQEVVIGGFTKPKGARTKFGALLIGVYDGKNLKYVGHVGGGFTERLLSDVYDKLQPLVTSKSPFADPPKPNTPVTWVKPKLVAEVSFSEWTSDDNLRQPIFKGLRIDKNPKSVKKEVPEA